MQFGHRCIDCEDGENPADDIEHCCMAEPKAREQKRRRLDSADKQDNQTLSAFEAFKKTDEYKAILKKMGKLNEPKDDDQKKLVEDKSTQPQAEPVDEKTRDLKRLKTYSYLDYIEHMESGHCHRQKTFKCPLKCCDVFMSYKELMRHLKKDCPLIEVTCKKCGDKAIRCKYTHHGEKKCVSNLAKKNSRLNERKRNLKDRRKTLLAELAKIANPGHEDIADPYETIGQNSNVLEQTDFMNFVMSSLPQDPIRIFDQVEAG